MNKIKVLQIVPSLSQSNGVAAYISEYFTNINKDNFEFTFLVLNSRDHGRYKEIEDNGGKIIELYFDKNIIRYINRINLFFKNNKFDIVHCHTSNYGALFMFYAYKYGIKHRILHSHVNKSGDSLPKSVRNKILSKLAVLFSNKYLACSKDAGVFLFKNRTFTIIRNSIDVDKYLFNSNVRKRILKEMGIKSRLIIGEFGRLCPQKNQLFTIDIMNEIVKKIPNAILILAGDGPQKDRIIKKVLDYGINKNVIFLGNRNDLKDLYNILDVFLLPSTYEGLGIVLIEAQANGLHCFTSKNLVPIDAKVSELLNYIELNNNPSEWANVIINSNKNRKNVRKQIIEKGYDIKFNSKQLSDYYKSLMMHNKEE